MIGMIADNQAELLPQKPEEVIRKEYINEGWLF